MNANDEAPSNLEPASSEKADQNEKEPVEDGSVEPAAKAISNPAAMESTVVEGAIQTPPHQATYILISLIRGAQIKPNPV